MGSLRTSLFTVLSLTLAVGGCLADFSSSAGNDAGPRPDAGPNCGDGVLDPGEVCDSTNLGGETCEGLGYESGALSCDGWCAFVESGCQGAPVCGDGEVGANEACDDGNARDWDGCTDCGISEFLVNAETAGNQVDPALIPLGEGFLAVWSTDSMGDSQWRVWGQRFDFAATADGTPFSVSDTVTLNGEVNRSPAAAPVAGGRFVVVWIRERPAEQRVVGQLFDSLNNPINEIFDVSDEAPLGDDSPAAAATMDGGFVVAWAGVNNGSGRILARRFSADAAPLGASSRADGIGVFEPSDPSVAVASGGDYLVAWTDDDPGVQLTVRAQPFLADGSKGSAIFVVPEDVNGWHSSPAVAATPGGGYIAVWEGRLNLSNGTWDIYARRFGPLGAPLEPDRLVNEQVALDQLRPAVAMGDSGFLVAWETQVDDHWDLAARILDFQGGMTSMELTTHVHRADWQTSAAVTFTEADNFIVAWQSDLQDGALWGVFAQRFTPDGTPLGVVP